MCLPQNERQGWKTTISKFHDIISGLQVRHAYSSDKVDAFQNMADDCFISWLDLVGYDGITNYFHMLGAGHVRYYLHQWGNLFHLQTKGGRHTMQWLTILALMHATGWQFTNG